MSLVGKTDFDFFSAELAEKYFADEQPSSRRVSQYSTLENPTFDHRTHQRLGF